ncbi:carbohydrate ABC transporter permease [Yonghaparkia sp. Soil809]|uniref:carbohydrate ABC transporter permease n=1 Tax=Yonghaparkia sp. Soil809 TaxID=1736417 RepID=UPI00190FD245|nr:sugar ABC transporter permease [Yonghaparkia sp. Soil809]
MASSVDRTGSPRRYDDRWIRGRKALGSAAFVAPSVALVVVFFVIPFVLNLPFAFSSWTGYSEEIGFIALDNFTLLADRGVLVTSTVVTVVYAVICMLVQNIVSVSLALSLRDATPATTFFRSIFFVPVLISPLAGGYIWRAIVSPDGPLNATIALGAPGFDFAWLGDPYWAVFWVAFVDAWKWCGVATLVYIAGLNSIPKELLEAADIDGAGRWRRFWSISFPLLAPAFTFNIVTTLIGALSAYDVVASMTGGGPGDSTTTLNFAVVQQFGYSFFGVASALNFFVTILVIVLAVPLVMWLRRREVAS